MTLHQKMALSDIGNPEQGLLLNAKEMDYVNKFLEDHPGYQGRIPKKSAKNPDSELRYSVVVVTGKDGSKQAYAIYNKVLGEGAYGKVKIYQNIRTGESVATKSISEKPENLKYKEMLLQEIEVLQNIGELHGTYSRKRIIDSTETEVNYLIMELGFGMPVDRELFDPNSGEKNPQFDVFDLTISENLRQQHLLNQTDIGLEVIRECLELHEKGYISRDIKMSNYLWDPEFKKAKLIDHGFDITISAAEQTRFALKKRAQDISLSAEEIKLLDNAFKGTPPYIAPEIWLSKGPGVETDYYSLGVMLANLMSLYEKESSYGLREDEDGEVYKDISETMMKILATGKDEELQEIFNEVYQDGEHLSSPPELQIMADVVRGLTHEDPVQRMTATQAYEKLIALKATLLVKLNHSNNTEFHNIKSELATHLKKIKEKVRAEADPTKKAELNKQEKLMTDLAVLTNLLSSTYPIADELLMRFKSQLDDANNAVRIKDPAFSHNIKLMENAFIKVAKARNLLEEVKENIPPDNVNKRPPPLKSQFDQQFKNKEPLRELHPPKVAPSNIALPGKKPKV